MQHVLNIAFDFDDERIKGYVENRMASELLERAYKDMASDLPKRYGQVDWRSMACDAVDRLLAENRDAICEMASDKLAERLARTKLAREALSKAVGDEKRRAEE